MSIGCRRVLVVSTMVIAAALAGCATSKKTAATSVIDLANDVVLLSVPLPGVAVHAALGKPTVKEEVGYKTTRQNFCPASDGSLVRAREQFQELCKVKGGTFDGVFCKRPSEMDDVPFMARIDRAGSGGCVLLRVAEPSGPTASPEYIAHLVGNGYRTAESQRELADARAAEHARLRAQQQAEAALRAERDRQRLALELPKMKKRGTQVCSYAGRNTLVGYVEDFTDEKLKVLVSSAHVTSAPSVAVRVEPGTLRWDDFATWWLCK